MFDLLGPHSHTYCFRNLLGSPLRGDSPQQGPFEARSKLKACVCNHKPTITIKDAAKTLAQPSTLSQVGQLDTSWRHSACATGEAHGSLRTCALTIHAVPSELARTLFNFTIFLPISTSPCSFPFELLNLPFLPFSTSPFSFLFDLHRFPSVLSFTIFLLISTSPFPSVLIFTSFLQFFNCQLHNFPSNLDYNAYLPF